MNSRAFPSSSLLALVAANLVPLAGVAFWNWEVGDVVFLYWTENLVIGAFNVLRMAFATGSEDAAPVPARFRTPAGESLVGRIFFIGFFIVHYGGFCYGHGVFLAHLFPITGVAADPEPVEVLEAMLAHPYTQLAILAIVASHAYSFLRNYIGRREFRRADINALMGSPYKRIVFTHVFILAGGFLLQWLGGPLAAMLLFVGMKTAFDAHAHVKEHARYAAPAA